MMYIYLLVFVVISNNLLASSEKNFFPIVGTKTVWARDFFSPDEDYAVLIHGTANIPGKYSPLSSPEKLKEAQEAQKKRLAEKELQTGNFLGEKKKTVARKLNFSGNDSDNDKTNLDPNHIDAFDAEKHFNDVQLLLKKLDQNVYVFEQKDLQNTRQNSTKKIIKQYTVISEMDSSFEDDSSFQQQIPFYVDVHEFNEAYDAVLKLIKCRKELAEKDSELVFNNKAWLLELRNLKSWVLELCNLYDKGERFYRPYVTTCDGCHSFSDITTVARAAQGNSIRYFNTHQLYKEQEKHNEKREKYDNASN